MPYVIALLVAVLAGCAGNGLPISTTAPTSTRGATSVPSVTATSTPPLTPTPTETVAGTIQLEDATTEVILRSDQAIVHINKASVVLTLEDARGALLTTAAAPAFKLPSGMQSLTRVIAVHVLARAGETRGVTLTCDADSGTAEWSVEFLTPRSIAARLRPADAATVTRAVTMLRAAPDEHYYGLTERIADARNPSEIVPQAVGSLDRRGETVTMVVTPTMSLYTPFFHSSREYGVYVEGTMTGRYDLAKSDPSTVVIDFEFNRRTGEHGVVYFVGDHDTILDEYTALTGRPFVPPRWGFRHLRWRDEHHSGAPARLDGVDMNAELVDDVTMYETLGIPVGNYEFDRPWTSGTTNHDQPGFTSFSFEAERFPNSDAMLAALQRRGYHAFVFVAPWALGDNAVDAEQLGYYAPRSDLLIDYTNPAAVTWWTRKVQSLVDLGITGLKLDRSEFERTELPVVPDQATDVFADGRNGRELKNGYTLEYARVHFDAMNARLGGNFVNYLRAGYAGSQRYGIFWGGDTPGTTNFGIGQSTDLGLRSVILSLAHVAFMGFPIWGSDTGGYYEFGDRDVFARWLELSAVCPLMEIGGGGTHAPWDMPTEPHYDTEMIEIYRRYVTLHHELVPLIYSLALGAHTSGRPLARPLVFDFPSDPMVADLWDEFLLGHDLLVAPLWQIGARRRQVYLPHGIWIDFWNPAQRITGPATVTVDAPLDRLPLYVRAGGILPLEVNSTATGSGSAASAGRLTVDAYPSGSSTFTLREDEGSTLFTLSDDCGSACARLQISASRRAYVVRVLTGAPARVILNGNPLEQTGSFAAFEQGDRTWFYEAGIGRLWVKFATDGEVVTLQTEDLRGPAERPAPCFENIGIERTRS